MKNISLSAILSGILLSTSLYGADRDLKMTEAVTDTDLQNYSNFAFGSTKLFFMGDDNNKYGNELYIYSEVTGETKLVLDYSEGVTDTTSFGSFTTIGDTLIFKNSSTMWVSDGTSEGTKILKDSDGETITYNDWRRVGNKLFFERTNDTVHGYELWVTDGTSDGTKLVKDFILGSDSSDISFQSDRDGRVIGFINNYYKKVFSSDGTEAGTEIIMDISSYDYEDYHHFGTYNGESYWYLRYRTNVNSVYTYYDEIWKTDGTPDGTEKLFALTDQNETIRIDGDIDTGSGRFSVNSKGDVLFMTDYKVYEESSESWKDKGRELWYYNNTSKDLYPISDITLGSSSTDFYNFEPLGNNLFIIEGAYESNVYPLWVTDGSESGTKKLLTKNGNEISGKYYGDGNRGWHVSLNGEIYFNSYELNNDYYGWELWKTDGTSEGTVMVKDIRKGGYDSDIYDYVWDSRKVFNNQLYFLASDGSLGSELWKTDGTEAGTQLVDDIRYGDGSSDITIIGEMNSKLYLIAQNGVDGFEVWATDGELTIDGQRFLDINVSQAIEETKKLCQQDPQACGIESVPPLSKEYLNSLQNGWQMVGSSFDIQDMSLFDEVDIVWYFQNGEWRAYSKTRDVLGNGVRELTELPSNSGFWILK